MKDINPKIEIGITAKVPIKCHFLNGAAGNMWLNIAFISVRQFFNIFFIKVHLHFIIFTFFLYKKTF